jgi:tetratricopeptide (TPR) repeat protein
VFARLAIFRGPFTREAAHQVAGATPSILASLVDKSLAWRRGQVYQLHEVARQFGWELLDRAGDVEATQARHAQFYAAFLARQHQQIVGHDQPAALAEVDQQIDNVRLAWQWLVEQRDAAGIAAATDGYYGFLAIRSRFRDAVEVFDAARLALQPSIADDPAARLTYYKVTARAGRFLSYQARYAEARALLDESLAGLSVLDDKVELAFVLNHLGSTARMEGDLALAGQHLQACLALRRETGNLAGQDVALLELAGVAFMAGDFEAARARCQEGLGVAEAAGDVQTTAHLLTGLSLSLRELGQFDQALAYGRRSQAIYQQLGDSYGQMQAFLTLGELSRQMGDLPQARHFCQQAAQISQEIGDRSGEADSYYRLGQIAADQDEQDEALRQLRLALELSVENRETPLILDALLEIGCLLAAEGDGRRAGSILRFLLTQAQFPERHRDRASRALAALPPSSTDGDQRESSLEEIVALASRTR